MLILAERKAKFQLEPSQESAGDAAVLSCSLLRNLSSNPTGVLEHCREGETSCWFLIF
jgi:hypothetical protein